MSETVSDCVMTVGLWDCGTVSGRTDGGEVAKAARLSWKIQKSCVLKVQGVVLSVRFDMDMACGLELSE